MDASPALAEGDVHVWRFQTDDDGSTANQLWPLLTSDERARAESARTPLQRSQFVLVRGLLRQVLSLYEPVAARRAFRYGPKGKPHLDGSELEFSLSHAGPFTLFALARAPVGIDIERRRARPYADAVARRLFPPDVQQALATAPEERREALFLQAWTQHEAGVKALGLSVYDRAADIPIILGDATGLVHAAAGNTAWTLYAVDAWPHTAAALASPSLLRHVRQWDARALR